MLFLMFLRTKDAEYGFQPAYLIVGVHLAFIHMVGNWLIKQVPHNVDFLKSVLIYLHVLVFWLWQLLFSESITCWRANLCCHAVYLEMLFTSSPSGKSLILFQSYFVFYSLFLWIRIRSSIQKIIFKKKKSLSTLHSNL